MAEAVGVVGAGIMGSGIAEVAARRGCDVVVREVDGRRGGRPGADRRAPSAGRCRSGKLHRRGPGRRAGPAALHRRPTTTWRTGRWSSRRSWRTRPRRPRSSRRPRKIVRPDCLLASNTSSIPIMKLAAATSGPDRVIGMHFFNPVPVLPLVELVPSLLTSPETLERAAGLRRRPAGQADRDRPRTGPASWSTRC